VESKGTLRLERPQPHQGTFPAPRCPIKAMTALMAIKGFPRIALTGGHFGDKVATHGAFIDSFEFGKTNLPLVPSPSHAGSKMEVLAPQNRSETYMRRFL